MSRPVRDRRFQPDNLPCRIGFRLRYCPERGYQRKTRCRSHRVFRWVFGITSVLHRAAVHGFGHGFGDLVERFLELASDHHTHHHIQFRVQHQPHAGIVGTCRLQLDPEGEVDGNAVFAALYLGASLATICRLTVKPLTLNEQLFSSACHSSTLSCTAGVRLSKRLMTV